MTKRKAGGAHGAAAAKPSKKCKAAPPVIAATEMAAAQSLATYTLKRDARISQIYWVNRVVKGPAIYDILVMECRECGKRKERHGDPDVPIKCRSFHPLITPNVASGVRMIQDVIKREREEAEPEEILSLRKPIETEKARRTFEHLLQIELDIISDDSKVKRQRLSPSGSIVSVIDDRYSEQDKNRAKKNALQLAERLGKLEGANLVAVEPPPAPGKGADGAQAQSFVFSFPNVTGNSGDVDALRAMNLDAGKVN